MKIIATLPPPHLQNQLRIIADHPLIDSARFNVGARSPWDPRETLEKIRDFMKDKLLYVDLKGRQLRVTQWAKPTYGDIVLNHEIEVDTPAEIIFRGAGKTFIREVRGNKVYVQPNPPEAIGAGQSVNIHGKNLRVKGYLTEEDKLYVKAAKEIGLHHYMLSFVEEEEDIKELIALDDQAKIVAKIESLKGLDFVCTVYPNYKDFIWLMAARDDLFTNIGDEKIEIFAALELILKQDSSAIVASKLLESLTKSGTVSLPDLSDLRLMDMMGYQRFMLSDELCFGSKRGERAFLDAMDVLENYISSTGRKT